MSPFSISHIIKPTLVLVIYFALCNYTLAQESEISASKVISGDTILRKILERDPYVKPVKSDYDLTYINESPNFINNDDTEVMYTVGWKPYSKTKRRDKHRIHKKTSGITCCPCQVRGRDINEPVIYDRMGYARRVTPISQQDGQPSLNSRRFSIPSGAQLVESESQLPVRVIQRDKPKRRTFFVGDWSGSSPSASTSLTSPAMSKFILDKVDDGRITLSHLLGKGPGKVQVGGSVGAAPTRPSPSKGVKVSYATPSVQGRVSNRPIVNKVGVSYGTSPKGGTISYQPPSTKGTISYQPPSTKGRVSYKPPAGQLNFSFGRRSDDTESRRPGQRTFYLGGDWLAPRPAVSTSSRSPAMAQFILDKVEDGRNALAQLLGHDTSNVQVDTSAGATRPRPRPSPIREENEYEVPSTEGRVSNSPTPKDGRVSRQPPAREERNPYPPPPRNQGILRQPPSREERVPNQPTQTEKRVPNQLVQYEERVPNQPVQPKERVPNQPAPTEGRVSYQPLLTEGKVSNQPAQSEERVPNQSAPSEERVPDQTPPMEERVPDQLSTRDEIVSNQPAPSEERVPDQRPPTEERVPDQPATRNEIVSNQPAPSDERVPDQPPPTEERVPDQPATRNEIVLNQPAPSDERVPDQPPPTEERVPDQPATRNEIVSNQPAPSEERVLDQLPQAEVGLSNQPSSTEVKVSSEPRSTELKNQIEEVAVPQNEGSLDAATY